MPIKEMTIEQINDRIEEIRKAIDADGADLDALEKEARELKEELEARKTAQAKRDSIRGMVAMGAGVVTDKTEAPTRPNDAEVRKSAEYCEAYKNYIITGNDAECRALLTETVSGTVPVPAIIEGGINTAWESDPILSRVKRTFIRGNLKVMFELSATGAYVHTEGTTAPTEESLTLGVVTMIPRNIKKWITISDEAVAMGGEAFVRYIYDEITYQIVKKAVALGIADITSASTTNGSTAVGVPKITEAPGITTIMKAAAQLSENAQDVVVIMNRSTEADFVDAMAAGNFAVDPFRGYKVLYTSALPAYSTADASAVYAIVGDLNGLQYNFPEGDGVVLKWDDTSLAEADMVKVVGREYAAHAVTGLGCFCNIAKPAAVTT